MWVTRFLRRSRRKKALCAEVPAAAAMFKRASEILGYDLLQVCAEGPKEKLDLTAVRATRQRALRAARARAALRLISHAAAAPARAR